MAETSIQSKAAGRQDPAVTELRGARGSASAEPTASARRTGDRLLRLRALGIDDVPVHKELVGVQTNAPNVKAFIGRAVEEGYELAEAIQKSFTGKKTRSVDLGLKVETSAKKIDGDFWCARSSEHADVGQQKKKGEASWNEFDFGLRLQHSQHEKDYTPNVYDCNPILSWEGSELDGIIEGWDMVEAHLYEMYHTIGNGLQDRVFTFIILTARRPDEFIIIQIPVSLDQFPDSVKEKSHRTFQATPQYNGSTEKKAGKKLTLGEYVSVERAKRIPTEGSPTEAKIIWEMATASNAKGVLPRFVQNMAIPGKIVEDVPLFLTWIDERRLTVDAQ